MEESSGHHDHGHGHGHQHDGPGHGPLRAAWAWLQHLVTPHSHDSADRVDVAMESSRRGMRTLAWSFAALTATALAQLVVVVLSGSIALLSDTIHNSADALTAVPLAIAFLLGRRAATRRFTYGLGRAEDLAGLVVVLLIAASAGLAAWQAISRLIQPQLIEHLWVVAGAGVIGFAGNELVARYRIKVGREIGSAALVADGLHARTDGFTSLAVVASAGGVALGFPLADPIIGLLITVAILFVLRSAIVEVFSRLLDAIDPAILEQAELVATDAPGVHGADQVRMRWIGHSLHAELAITVDSAQSVEKAHRIAHDVEHRLLHAIPRLATATVHTEPAGAHDVHHELAHHR
jgi:cation diffusion facilitator family transporter